MDNEILIFLYPDFLFILHLLDFEVISYRSFICRYVHTPCSSLLSSNRLIKSNRCDGWNKLSVTAYFCASNTATYSCFRENIIYVLDSDTSVHNTRL